jgi:hypothetical protein
MGSAVPQQPRASQPDEDEGVHHAVIDGAPLSWERAYNISTQSSIQVLPKRNVEPKCRRKERSSLYVTSDELAARTGRCVSSTLPSKRQGNFSFHTKRQGVTATNKSAV